MKAAAAILCLGLTAQAPLSVIDGDTVRQDGWTYRLVGFNTPELHAQCPSEYAMAVAAKSYLERLITSGRDPHLQEVTCNGWNYGRKCARLWVNGQDIAADMLETQLAESYDCTKGCPRRRNWCQKDQTRARRLP